MKKTLLAVIIAATALVPPAALAQDRGRWGGRDRGANSSGGEVRQNRGEWRQQQSQQTPQAQPQRQWNGGGGERPRQWNGGGERQRGNWSRPQAQPQTTPQAVPQQSYQQRQQQRWGGGRGDRGQWNNNGDRSRWTGNRGQWNGGDRRPDAGQAPQQGQQVRDRDNRTRWNGDRSQFNRGNRDWNGRPRTDWNGSRDWNGNDRNRWNSNDRDRDRSRNWSGDRGRWDNDRNRGRWNNNWRSDRRYDWRGYRSSNRNIYRLPRYYAPSSWGYGYRRFSIGFMLDTMLYSSNYWINDPFYYRLPEVDGPYRWVRYYNDALLVDIYSGEVVDVIYDIFW